MKLPGLTSVQPALCRAGSRLLFINPHCPAAAAPRQLCHGPLRRTASVVVCVALAVVDFIVAPR